MGSPAATQTLGFFRDKGDCPVHQLYGRRSTALVNRNASFHRPVPTEQTQGDDAHSPHEHAGHLSRAL